MEMEYYIYLLDKFKNFPDVEIKLQPVYELQPKFSKCGKNYRAITYKSDFEIIRNGEAAQIIDVKGFETADFKIKEKLFKYKYDIDLTIVTRSPKWCYHLSENGWIELGILKKLRSQKKKGLI